MDHASVQRNCMPTSGHSSDYRGPSASPLTRGYGTVTGLDKDSLAKKQRSRLLLSNSSTPNLSSSNSTPHYRILHKLGVSESIATKI
jgi:hypothetical protein